ncbi:MAG: glycoside hydrolase family 5 protein, partial [Clostridiales bacterium]|nr:glycoside hydrolase family 5 protein [Clostridiales bacterium]
MGYITAKKSKLYINEEAIILRGFGLGGWLLPEGYMWKLYTKCDRPRRMEAMIASLCGLEYEEQFWVKYYDSYITSLDIKLIAEEGFNSIRLPLNSRHLFTVDNGNVTFNEKILAYIDQCIHWCKEEGIYVILDMHGAFGGQTGQNIDDSEDDKPNLFIDKNNQELLIHGWELLAARYEKETTVVGYDLLNEPLPKWHNQYNSMLLPLYRKLITAIRKIDKNHLIILEGLHWATDFSVFDEFTKEEAANNIMLQFHKYWNSPDAESIETYVNVARSLEVPLFMGEGGENNCDWYTMLFPMLEREEISWSFWSYKKMDCMNSPITFPVPENWNWITQWIDGERQLSKQEAIAIFDDLISKIQSSKVNQKVINALKRMVPLTIPCEAYDFYDIVSNRQPGASFRITDPVTMLFPSGKEGDVNYERYGGEEQPESENLVVQLSEGDMVGYYFYSNTEHIQASIKLEGHGDLEVSCGSNVSYVLCSGKEKRLDISLLCNTKGKNEIRLSCVTGKILVDYIALR